jgi:Flp pilus assembly pilin Flp
MKQILLLIVLIPFLSISQVQIGADIDGEAAGDQSGRSVSLSSDGSIVAIGARGNDGNGNGSGHVRVYENVSGTWTQIGTDIDGEAAGDSSGSSVCLSSDGSIVAIGAISNDGNGSSSGHVRVYENVSGIWVQIGTDIDGEAANDFSGFSISLSSDGSILAIGSTENSGNGSSSGHVRVYENVSGTWTQIGQDIDGEAANDNSGNSISLSSDGSILAIGARGNDGNGSNSGHVRIYENVSGTWIQIGQDIDGEATGDQSGSSVNLSSDGSFVAIGAVINDGNGSDSGHVRVYKNVSGTWTQIGQDIDGEATGDQSSSSNLNSDGSIIAIGAAGNGGNGSFSGHVRVYENVSGIWTQIGQDIDGEAASDFSGFSISLSSDGSNLAIGAFSNDGNGTDSGHVRVYDLSGITLTSNSFVLENFSISPNPATDKMTITLNTNLELKAVTVYNYFGQKIKTTQSKEIDLSDVSAGVYFIEIETNKGKASKKIVKE